MKTPREILLSRHKHVEPKLDSLRHEVLRAARSPVENAPQKRRGILEANLSCWRELLLFARWHLTGLAGIWLIVAVLRVSDTVVEAPPLVQAKADPPHSIILTLIENRRRVLEFSGGAIPVPPLLPSSQQQRRSLLQTDWACV